MTWVVLIKACLSICKHHSNLHSLWGKNSNIVSMYTNEQVTKNRMFISIFSINLLNLNSIFPLFMNAQLSTTMAGGFGNQSLAESCNYTCYLYLCMSMWEKSHKTANILIQSIGSGIFFQVNHFTVSFPPAWLPGNWPKKWWDTLIYNLIHFGSIPGLYVSVCHTLRNSSMRLYQISRVKKVM